MTEDDIKKSEPKPPELGTPNLLALWAARAGLVVTLALGFLLCFRYIPLGVNALGFALAAAATFGLKRAARAPLVNWSGMALTAGSIVVMIALFEIGLRVSPWRTPPQDVMQPHAEAIFVRKPNRTQLERVPLNDGTIAEVAVSMSHQGLRNDPIPPKTTSEQRIVLLGDSFTMGAALNAEDTISAHLQRLIDHERRKVRVINAGHAGYAPWQERIFLRERVIRHDPDLVILQLFPPNDVSGSIEKFDEWLPAYAPKWRRVLTYARNFDAPPVAAERWMRTYSQIYLFLVRRQAIHTPVRDLLERCRLFPQVDMRFRRPEAGRDPLREACLVDWYPQLQRAWEEFAADVRGIVEDCRARGIDIAVYSHSGQHALDPAFWNGLNRRKPELAYEMDKDLRLVRELCAELDVPYIDVFPKMREHHDRGSLYHRNEGHFSPAGAAFVAETLYNFLTNAYFSEDKTMDNDSPVERRSSDDDEKPRSLERSE